MIQLIDRYGIFPKIKKRYLIDTSLELSELETTFGNEAYCITEKKTYICNGTGTYVEKESDSGGGGGSGDSKLADFVNRGLETITADDLAGITQIARYRFYKDKTLKSITIPDTVTEIGTSAFEDSSIASIRLPKSLTRIGANAFKSCVNVEGVVIIPQGVIDIPEYCFSGCAEISGVTFLGNVTSIELRAFQNVSELNSITLPATVVSIGAYAFNACGANEIGKFEITINATTPPTLANKNAFGSIDNLTIYVPAESVTAYQTTSVWSNYAANIQAIPET